MAGRSLRRSLKRVLGRLSGWSPARGATLLIYHRIGGGSADELDLPTDVFARQLDLLASHKVPARVTGGMVTPRLVRYHLSTPLGVKVRQVAGLSEEIALSLGAPSCRVYREEGRVEVEVPRAQGQAVALLPLLDRLRASGAVVPPVTAVLGLDQEGMPLLVRLPSANVAHVLIAGTTGSGKTTLALPLIHL